MRLCKSISAWLSAGMNVRACACWGEVVGWGFIGIFGVGGPMVASYVFFCNLGIGPLF